MTRLATALILSIGLFLQAAPVLAQETLGESCLENFACICADASYPEIQEQVAGITDTQAGSQACAQACSNFGATGTWKLFCNGSQKNQGEIPAPSTPAEKQTEYQVPVLAVPIPGLVFTAPYEKDGYLYIPYIAQYVKALYSLVIVIGAIGTILTIMISGMKWMVARGDSVKVGSAKDSIGTAFTSLFILLGVVSLTNLVDPDLVNLGSLRIQKIKLEQIALQEEIGASLKLQGCQDVKGLVEQCSATQLKNPGGWDTRLVNAINQSAQKYGTDPIQIAAHVEIETRHNINWGSQIGPCGEIGPSQFMPTTYEAVTGDSVCCTAVSRKSGESKRSTSVCDENYVAWPPNPSEIPNCRTDICGSCQVAASSCIAKFESPTNIQHVIDTTAQYVRQLRGSAGGDIAGSMCAYNGSGEAAANYARTAAEYYEEFCNASK